MEATSEVTTDSKPENLEKWPDVLNILAGQMTKAAFGTWLHGTAASVEGDTLTIYVKSNYAIDWIETRLKEMIARTVASVTGESYTITAKLAPSNGKPLPSPDLQPGQFSTEIVYADPRQKKIATSIYVIRFWQPFLTPEVFLTWLTLRAFAWDEDRMTFPSIELLAATCTNKNRHKLLGRAAREGREAVTGSLPTLEQLNFIRIRTDGEGREKRYYFKVLEQLPVLTPQQVSWLPLAVQRGHKSWLFKYSLGYEEWEQLTLSQETV